MSNDAIFKYSDNDLVDSYLLLNIITLTAFLRLLFTLSRCVFGAPPQVSIPYSVYGLMKTLYNFCKLFFLKKLAHFPKNTYTFANFGVCNFHVFFPR